MKKTIILASKSPQRKKLLKTILRDFEVKASNIDETFSNNLSVYDNVKKIAFKKANFIKNNFDSDCIIACDTVCYLDNKVLTKPLNRIDAFNTIKSYNNKKQEVITGVCIITEKNVYNFYETSYVIFKDVTDESINKWLDKNRFMDKAGSFEILEAPKYFSVEIEGSINNIVGLPTEKIKEILFKEKLVLNL